MDEMIYDTRMHNARNGTGFILALFGLIGIMVMFTEAMIIPALPTLQAEFNTTASMGVMDCVNLPSRQCCCHTHICQAGRFVWQKEVPSRVYDLLYDWRHRQRLCVEFTVAHSIQGPSRHGPGDVPARIRHHPGRIST